MNPAKILFLSYDCIALRLFTAPGVTFRRVVFRKAEVAEDRPGEAFNAVLRNTRASGEVDRKRGAAHVPNRGGLQGVAARSPCILSLPCGILLTDMSEVALDLPGAATISCSLFCDPAEDVPRFPVRLAATINAMRGRAAEF